MRFIFLFLIGISLYHLDLSADDDRASRDNADNARDSNDNGTGRGVDCGCCDWQSRDRDGNQPGNDNEERGTIPMCGDSKD